MNQCWFFFYRFIRFQKMNKMNVYRKCSERAKKNWSLFHWFINRIRNFCWIFEKKFHLIFFFIRIEEKRLFINVICNAGTCGNRANWFAFLWRFLFIQILFIKLPKIGKFSHSKPKDIRRRWREWVESEVEEEWNDYLQTLNIKYFDWI